MFEPIGRKRWAIAVGIAGKRPGHLRHGVYHTAAVIDAGIGAQDVTLPLPLPAGELCAQYDWNSLPERNRRILIVQGKIQQRDLSVG